MSIRYHSNVVSSARDRGPHHLRTPSTPGGALMEESRGHDRHPRNVYDIASALPGMIPAPSTSVISGRRTDMVITSRTAKEGAPGGEARPLHIRPRRGVQVPLRVEVPGPRADHGRCIVFRRRLMFVISTLRCRCLKPLPRGTAPRKACVVGGSRVLVQKSRLVPNPRTIFARFPDPMPYPSGVTNDRCLNPIQNSTLAATCLRRQFREPSTNLVPRDLSN